MKIEKVAFIGFMASGKSTIGQLVASHMQMPFVDLDRYVETLAGQSIESMFASAGEAFFRRYEQTALRRIHDEMKSVILSTGGGIVTQEVCRALLKEEFSCIYLRARADTIVARLTMQETVRPLLQVEDRLSRVESLMREREQWYGDIADFIIDVDDVTVADVVEEAMEQLI